MNQTNQTGETWVLEYSAEAERRGLFPYHVTLKTVSDRSGPGPLGWAVIATGTAEAMTAELETKASALKFD